MENFFLGIPYNTNTMNSSTRSSSKRSFSFKSPKMKRPKLDFTVVPETTNVQNGIFFNGHEERTKKDDSNCDWDDDEFSGVLLEKACELADFSQVVDEIPPDKSTLVAAEQNGKQTSKPHTPPSSSPNNSLLVDIEKLKESLKTKEGEVFILRSQLKQNQDAKFSENVNHLKLIEETKLKYESKVAQTEKELESATTKLHFKDLEIKNLMDRCKQLESNNKFKLIEPHAVHVNSKRAFNLTQSSICEESRIVEPMESSSSHLDDVIQTPSFLSLSSKKMLRKILCPHIFQSSPSKHILQFYSHINILETAHGLEFNKKEKYIWSDLPKQRVYVRDTWPLLSALLQTDTFEVNSSEQHINSIIELCGDILKFEKDTLSFLKKSRSLLDNEDPDQLLLDNEEQASLVKVEDLLCGEVKRDEAGIEGRRATGVIIALMGVSTYIIDLVLKNTSLLNSLCEIMSLISELRRPIRYANVTIGILKIFQLILKQNNLQSEHIKLTSQVVKKAIFSRSKLNIVIEIITLLRIGTKHKDLIHLLCSSSSIDSCTLFIDSKIQNVMLFTENACPLYVLFTQIMGLINLPSSSNIRPALTREIVKWLNYVRDISENDNITWLSSVISSEAKGFDLTNFCSLLLYLLVQDLSLKVVNSTICSDLNDLVGTSAFILKRVITIMEPNVCNNKMFGLLCALSLNNSHSKLSLTENHLDCINWITEGFALNEGKGISTGLENKKCSTTEKELTESLSYKLSDLVFN